MKKQIQAGKVPEEKWFLLHKKSNSGSETGTDESPRRKKYPTMCEPDLEKQVADKFGDDPENRRRLADVYARWARQLYASAELIEKMGAKAGSEADIVFPDTDLADALRYKSPARALEIAAGLEQWICEIRRCVRARPKARPAHATFSEN